MVKQVVAVLLEETGPTVLIGNLAGLVIRRLTALSNIGCISHIRLLRL